MKATLYGVVIAELLFDEENEGKLASHAISVEQAWQVLDNPYVLEPNRLADEPTTCSLAETTAVRASRSPSSEPLIL